jgi:hypothetical protein
MARLFVTGINLNKNELQNARIQNLSAAPSSPVAGQVYYNTSDNIMYFYNGSTWISTSGSLEVIQDAIGAYVVGGTALTATYDDNAGTTTIDLDNTAVAAGSYGTTAAKTASFTVDAQGRLTAASEQDVQITTSQVTGLEEFIEDTVGDSVAGLVKEGEGIDVTYDDTAGTLTIAAEDATSSNKGIASFNSTDFTVSTGAVTLNAERVEDIVGNLVIGGTGIDATYSDGAGTLSIDIDSTVATLTGSQTLTNKTLGSGTVLGSNLDANNNTIQNLKSPGSANDAATKAYVDAVAEGLKTKPAVEAATTANLDATYSNGTNGVGATLTANSNGAFPEIDGHSSWSIGNGVLVKNQTSALQNGRYVVTTLGDTENPWVLTRCGLCDEAYEIPGMYIFVQDGSLNANTGWVATVSDAATFAVGTDAITFYQFSGAGTYTAGAGLTIAGTEFSVDVTPSSGNATLINTGGAVEVKLNTNDGLESTASGIGINNGTGLTFASGALVFDTANGYGTRKLAYNVGDNSATSYTVNHALATRDIAVHVYENASPYAQVEADVEHTDSNNLTIKFALAPTTDQYRVVVIG